MSLAGDDADKTHGAIRNVELINTWLPDWQVRIYIADQRLRQHIIPAYILTKLTQLGAHIQQVKLTGANADLNQYLVMNDKTVRYFLVRNVEQRFSELDLYLVKAWLKQDTPVFCVKSGNNSVAGLFGGRKQDNFQGVNLSNIITQNRGMGESTLLQNYMISKFYNQVQCLDLVNEHNITKKHNFLLKDEKLLSTKFDKYEMLD